MSSDGALHARRSTCSVPPSAARAPPMSPSPTRRRRPPARPSRARSRRGPAPPVPLRHPAALLSLAVAVTCLLVSVTTRLYDTDLWQHLLVGNVIWATHTIPTRQLWSWPTYGSLDVTSSWSWAFRALLWPLWSAFGVWGLYALRWTAALAAFALAWATARRLGARDLPALLVFAVGTLVFRQRAQVRPELVAAALLALAQWILETRRAGGPDRAAARLGAGR